MAVPYTMGIWQVKAGRGDDFVAAWTEFAEWTTQNAEGSGKGTLLRDVGDQNRFISIGPWESRHAIDSWRTLPGWIERVGRIRDLLERFEPATLEFVIERG
jgi:heme-degrading monooxygenase HmoA